MKKSKALKYLLVSLATVVVSVLLSLESQLTPNQIAATIITAFAVALITGYDLYLRRRNEVRSYIHTINCSINRIIADANRADAENRKQIFQLFSRTDANILSSSNKNREELRALITALNHLADGLANFRATCESQSEVLLSHLSTIGAATSSTKCLLERELSLYQENQTELNKLHQIHGEQLNSYKEHESKTAQFLDDILSKCRIIESQLHTQTRIELEKIIQELHATHTTNNQLANKLPLLDSKIVEVSKEISKLTELSTNTKMLVSVTNDTLASQTSTISREMAEVKLLYNSFSNLKESNLSVVLELVKEIGSKLAATTEAIGSAQKKADITAASTQAILESITSSLEIAAKIDLESKEKLLELLSA